MSFSRVSFQRLVALAFIAYAHMAIPAGALAEPQLRFHLSLQQSPKFDRINIEDGLSQTMVLKVYQDSYGFMWFGSQEGLNRYDGYTFENYYHLSDKSSSISDDGIWDVLEDTQRRLWIATDFGLNRYLRDTNSFESILVGPQEDIRHNIVRVIAEDTAGNLWLGTGLGLCRMFADGSFEHFHHDPEDSSSIGPGGVRALLWESDDTLWVGTEMGGLNHFDPATGKFTRFEHVKGDSTSIPNNFVRALVFEQGDLWVGTAGEGIAVFDTDSEQFETIYAEPANPRALGSGNVRTFLRDRRGQLWIGTDDGLHLWNSKDQSFRRLVFDPTDPGSISNDIVFSLFQDSGGVIWAGTFDGISKWNAETPTFGHYKHNRTTGAGLIGDSVTSFAESENGNVWIGTLSGVNLWDAQTNQFFKLTPEADGLSNGQVMSLLVDSQDRLWIGTMGGGVNVFENGKITNIFRHDAGDTSSINGDGVSRFLEDSKGRLWVGTYGGGVNRYLGEGKLSRYPNPSKPKAAFSDVKVVDIKEGPDGRLWIGTDGGGLIVLDPDTDTTVILRNDPAVSDSLGSDNVITMLITEKQVWVGTRDKGISKLAMDSGTFETFDKSNGLASDIIYGLLQDDVGRVWMSTAKGLSVFDEHAGGFRSYDYTHGLQNDDFNSGAYLKLGDGSLMFGGNNGFNVFDPEKIKTNDFVPRVHITSITKFNKPQSFDGPTYEVARIELNHDDSVIGFEFASLDFTAPLKNQYRYKLEGFPNEEWVEAGTSRQVTYTNLDPGDYVFRVQGSNNDGVWNEEGASVAILVNPPLWATWWAYVLYALVMLFVLYQSYQYNAHRLHREAERRYNRRLQLYIESLEEATDCVLIADADRKMLYANNAIRDIIGTEPIPAIGKPMMNLIFSDEADAVEANDGLMAEGRWHGEVDNSRNGEQYTAEVTVSGVKDINGQVIAYVSILRDVTGRKLTEAELEKHRQNLASLVEERTVALSREIAENKAIQKDLSESLKEKELLLKEVHHRVKNNMQVISSLLNIQGESVEDEEFANLLGESQQRIKSMALIHENLYQSENLLEINFEDYINMLANSLCRFYTVPGVSVHLDVQVDDVSLDIETAVPCGLIINELISNSLKHAFKETEGTGTIKVSFYRDACSYVLKIKDDGIGLPESFDLENTTSMGLEIISILTQQLDGNISAKNDKGASFEISFPGVEKRAA